MSELVETGSCERENVIVESLISSHLLILYAIELDLSKNGGKWGGRESIHRYEKYEIEYEIHNERRTSKSFACTHEPTVAAVVALTSIETEIVCEREGERRERAKETKYIDA